MEVIVGPTFSIEVSVPDDFAIDRSVSAPPPGKVSSESSRRKVSAAAASPCISSKNVKGDCPDRRVAEIESVQMTEYSSDGSSSIGTPGDSEDEAGSDEDDVVRSEVDRLRVQGLGSLSSLEDSLPIKRGLSSHYKGKSKSFGNLAEISTVKQVEKQENPLNKKRRLQICSKWSRKSFYSWQNPKSMPLLPVNEDEEDDDGEEEDEKDDGKSGFDENKSSLSSSSDDDDNVKGMRRRQQLKLQGRKMKSFKAKNFKSQSCFALSDLQEEEDE